MNIYRGCEHRCIYCDSRSDCYRIENFDDILVKTNAIELLKRELSSKRVKGTVGTGAMSDPYTSAERELSLTGQALRVIADWGFPVHITTKSDLVLKDLEVLKEISRVHASIGFTVTTADDTLAQKLEPGAPPSSERFLAMKKLAAAGIYTGVQLMPVLPFLEDTVTNITRIVELAYEHGAGFIVPWFGLSMRDGQREYFYSKLDSLFPGLRRKYERTYGNSYNCPVPNSRELGDVFRELCEKKGITCDMSGVRKYSPASAGEQLRLIE